jgi:hypothetical protein
MLMPQIGKTQAPLRNHALGLMQAGSFVHGASEKNQANRGRRVSVGKESGARLDLI